VVSDLGLSSKVGRSRSVVAAAAVVVSLVACAGLAALRAYITNTTAVLLLVLVVVAAASTGERLAGLLAALSGGVWFDIEATVVLVIIGAAVSELALWGRRQGARASRCSGYLDGVLGTAELITLRRESARGLLHHVTGQIAEVLEIDGCRSDDQIALAVLLADQVGTVIENSRG
jgi:hypothetical protein